MTRISQLGMKLNTSMGLEHGMIPELGAHYLVSVREKRDHSKGYDRGGVPWAA